MAAGTPVVAMARGCLPSLVEPKVTGYLAEDEAHFTAELGRMAELDPEACAATARRRFSPEVMARGYERLYTELLARTATGAAPRGGRMRVGSAPPARGRECGPEGILAWPSS